MKKSRRGLAWKIELTPAARRQLGKLNAQTARRISAFLKGRLGMSENPRLQGEVLSGALGQLLRYWVGDYRILCELQDQRLVVLAVKIGHRSDVYR